MARKRLYIHNNDSEGEGTRFTEVDKNVWECDYGNWEGTTKDGDELTLHHACGTSTYKSYKDI